MPDRAAHIRQAEHNEALCTYLDAAAPPYVDWQVTSLFYAALHYVDAYLAMKPNGGVHPRDHLVRDNLVATERSLRPIYLHYQELKNRSIDTRYEVVSPSPAQLRRLRVRSFTQVRAHLRQLLGLAI
jgi:hypothetical protein